MAAKFAFSDLHSFKDYVGFVQLCAPTDFPVREGVGPDEQWTLELAFKGLRVGLRLARREKGEQPALAKARTLVEDAYAAYRDGRMRDGFFKLAEVEKLLKTIRTQ